MEVFNVKKKELKKEIAELEKEARNLLKDNFKKPGIYKALRLYRKLKEVEKKKQLKKFFSKLFSK